MDWNNVTVGELYCAVRESDWNALRPLREFATRFSTPKSGKKLASRAKCNVYYYRANYVCILLFALAGGFVRNPLALIGVGLAALGALTLNDEFANSLNSALLKALRKVNPRAAQRLRSRGYGLGAPGSAPPQGSRGAGARILGTPRDAVAAALGLLGLAVLWLCGGFVTLLLALLVGCGTVAAHASLRSPNLKAKLQSGMAEFKASWRGYQADFAHDLTA